MPWSLNSSVGRVNIYCMHACMHTHPFTDNKLTKNCSEWKFSHFMKKKNKKFLPILTSHCLVGLGEVWLACERITFFTSTMHYDQNTSNAILKLENQTFISFISEWVASPLKHSICLVHIQSICMGFCDLEHPPALSMIA